MTNKRKIQRVKKAQARPERIRMRKRVTAIKIAEMYPLPLWCNTSACLIMMEHDSRRHRKVLAEMSKITQALENYRNKLRPLEAD